MRSILFAGATRPDLVGKVARSGPDAVIIDLEDAVPESSKADARLALRELVGMVGEPPVYVRINGLLTEHFEADCEAVRGANGITGVLVPKVEAPADLDRAREAVGDHLALVAGIESARGVARAEEILAGGPAGAYFGAEDFVADMAGRRTSDSQEVLFARSQVALAARLGGVPALDQVVTNVRDDAAFERDAAAGRAIGYRGKLCIHPAQVPIANAVFGATEAEVEHARRLIAAWEDASARGVGAVAVDGEMVDEPVLRMARDTLARAGG